MAGRRLARVQGGNIQLVVQLSLLVMYTNAKKNLVKEFLGVTMPAKSKKQRKLFGLIRKCQETGECISPKIKELSKSVSPKAAHDFAVTKEKGLPTKVKKTFKEWLAENHPE